MHDKKPRIAWKPLSLASKVASARLRCQLPMRYLQEAGWDCEIYLDANKSLYDIVIFQKNYEAEDLALARELRAQGTKTVFDLCDNHFYNPDNLPKYQVRAEKLCRMIEAVDYVTASTPALADVIPHDNITIIDDAIDDLPFSPMRDFYWRVRLNRRIQRIRSHRDRLRLVWYGNAGVAELQSGIVDIKTILPHLEAVNRIHPVSLSVISSSHTLFKKTVSGTSFPTMFFQWKKDHFPYLFREHDICLIPVTINPFTACKTNNRVVLSLMLGVPVIADPIESYKEFSPFIAFSNWEENLLRMAADKAEAAQRMQQGRDYILANHGRQRVASQWSAFLTRALQTRALGDIGQIPLTIGT